MREGFEQLRAGVLAGVAARLRVRGIALDRGELEACYGQAWQGLYGILLDGREVDNPAGWLTVVTYRRALDEHRARLRACGPGSAQPAGERGSADRDLADELDDRARLRQLLEAMRARLTAREREAAALCYLQGLSRREAARRMGLGEARMRKLMDGAGAGRLGVAGKVGAIVESVRDGRWCEEQASLMRAFAFGVLDPDGERYQLAQAHRRACPACRTYVLTLRGLAAALPPALGPLRLIPIGGGVHAGAGAAHGGAAGGHGAGASLAPSASGLGGAPSLGGLSSAGAASAGAGGASAPGWLLAGPLAAKLAVGCVLALGIGAGCVALGGAGGTKRSRPAPGARARAADTSTRSPVAGLARHPRPRATRAATSSRGGVLAAAVAPSATREFTPEQPPSARALAAASASAGSSPTAGAASSAAAEREFSP